MLKEIYYGNDFSLIKPNNYVDLIPLFYISMLFRSGLDSFPLKSYNQRYKLKSIETYRLDGLTGSDFYMGYCIIWNYKEWVSNLNKWLQLKSKNCETVSIQPIKCWIKQILYSGANLIRRNLDTVSQKLIPC